MQHLSEAELTMLGHGWRARNHVFLGHFAETVLRYGKLNGGEHVEDGNNNKSDGGKILRYRCA
ncbi:hypothetical protein C4D60_Mb06t12670 [Musa balbisiana]|uniref:Uncharacterized protein n=1 Tax=Musa balbisiana TaxID=52838 RepID=A0A4S8IML7_MUSBA|nr:hypothetical protein C4D60_Mb06t12670 [Musa balbisiana]